MLIGDVKESDPEEALHEMGNTPKVGVGIVHVFREALELIGNPNLTKDNAKVLRSLESLQNNYGNPPKRSRALL